MNDCKINNYKINEITNFKILNELKYNSIMLIKLFYKNKKDLYNIYGNTWLLCNVVDGKLNVIQSGPYKADLEEIGFQVVYDGLFNVFNPAIRFNP